jgi:ABC-type multidrug transport system ATPase subunit
MSGLHADSVRKQIGNKQILNDVFISCKPGQIIGLLGRNGSGKSTLLKIIFGSLNADNKYVAVEGKKINSLFDSRNLIKYLPQDNCLPNHLTIKNIIRCFFDRENAFIVSEHPMVRPFLKQKIKQLSGGEKRIIEIIIMIHSDATYIMLDEPFSGISPLHIDIIKELLKEHSNNKGFIITDHSYKNVLDISTTVILMDNGNTKLIKDCKQLIDLGYLPPQFQDT